MNNPTTKDGNSPNTPMVPPKCPGCGKELDGTTLQMAIFPVIQQGAPWWSVLFHNTCGTIIPFMFVPVGTGMQKENLAQQPQRLIF